MQSRSWIARLRSTRPSSACSIASASCAATSAATDAIEVLARGRHPGAAREGIHRRSSIWIGPSRRPWVNWSTTGLPLCMQIRPPARSRRSRPWWSIAAMSPMRARARHVVRDRDRGAAEPLDAIDDQPVDHRAHDRVEAGGRLVEEQDVGLGGDGAGQADALLHAAGELRRREVADAGGEPDLGQHVAGAARAPRRASALCWASRPKATFSQTGRLSNSAPFWNSMPMRARTCSRSRRSMRRMSWPSISITPASGSIRPRMHFSSTDLPVPEPPITTIEVPGITSRSTPSSTRLSPKLLRRPRMRIFGPSRCRRAD